MQKTLLMPGCGYSSQRLATRLLHSGEGWRAVGTTRDKAKAESLRGLGIAPLLFDGKSGSDDLRAAAASATHILHSIPPEAEGDSVYPLLAAMPLTHVRWFGYLSTTGVYGDRGGGWVDETDAPLPNNVRTKLRVAAENNWLNIYSSSGVPVHVFRLAGIYGPGRSAIDDINAGTARRIERPGQYFSRIHVDDLVTVLAASMHAPAPGQIYNVCDDEPAPSGDVVEYASRLMGRPPPPLIPYEQADLTPMARSFYESNRRVRNDKIKRELGIALSYPTYREGLAQLLLS